ncbi:MAG: hypothetical protein HIU84_03580 [Acidobacteria bacterium]|nr:hypothetical protein [Acidobacteriota bacterium]
MAEDDGELITRLMGGDASLFSGTTAPRALGWLGHPERYFTTWLDEVEKRLPRRYARALLLGMGGSSSPARFFAESRPDSQLTVLDTSNPDTIASTEFSHVSVIASSKSGATIETQTVLAHALASGLEPEDLVIITDPGTSLGELGRSLGAVVVEGDPLTGGRFSSLSPFGLVPALYAGWSPDEVRSELSACHLTPDLIEGAIREAGQIVNDVVDSAGLFRLGADPISCGGALWLEQLIAETTGKQGRGLIPVFEGDAREYLVSSMQHYHLVASLVARYLGVDPFNQPDVERAKLDVFQILKDPVLWEPEAYDNAEMLEVLYDSRHIALQAYVPLSQSQCVSEFRQRVSDTYGITTANLGPRYLHSTGQLHKGGPRGVVGVQLVQRPKSAPIRISGRRYSFHDLHMAQAQSDLRAMREAGRSVFQLIVDDMDEAARFLSL